MQVMTNGSLSLRRSFFPIVSSELDRDRELMKGEVDGGESKISERNV